MMKSSKELNEELVSDLCELTVISQLIKIKYGDEPDVNNPDYIRVLQLVSLYEDSCRSIHKRIIQLKKLEEQR